MTLKEIERRLRALKSIGYAFKAGKVGIDLRMHLKEKGSVRNRGTAFRIKEIDLWDLYSNIRNLGI
jgi:hypothetical protein